MTLRKQISEYHPIFGDGWRMLTDNDIILPGDESACVSTMLSLDGAEWIIVDEMWECFGRTVEWYCNESSDGDRDERIFRRRRT